MTSLPLLKRPSTVPGPETQPDSNARGARRHHLRSLPGAASMPRSRPRIAHGAVALGGLAAIVVAQLGISVALGEGAFQLRDLESASADLARQEQTLAEDVAVLASPQNVSLAADELGMRAGDASQFLSLTGAGAAGGPDALHLPTASVGGAGMTVPNALLNGQPAAAENLEAAAEEAKRGIPGTLLPPKPADVPPGTLLESDSPAEQ